MSIEVREFERSDLVEVVMAAQSFHEESPHHRRFPFSIAKVEDLVLNALVNPDWLTVVAFDGRKCVGLGLFACMPMFFSEARECVDLTWWVHPKYRGTRAGLNMLKIYKQWAIDLGAGRAQIGVNTGIETERTGRLLSLLGFEQHGTIHVLELV